MMHPSGANARVRLPLAAALAAPSVSVPAESAHAAQTILEQLRNSSRPPFDHADYALPLKSAADNWRLAELDAQIRYLRMSDFDGFEEQAASIIHEQHCRSLMATRETVQDFLSNGRCPPEPEECRALALFLLTNRLFGALTWLVVQSDTDTLDLQRCKLGNEGAESVAEWAGTIPFKVRLDLSQNGITAAGAGLLAQTLAANTIAELDLGSNPLGDEGVQLVCAGLARNTSVRSLLLYGVDMAGAGMQAIAAVLDSHPGLGRVNLDSNAFDDAAAAALAAALAHNRTLASLSINHADASDAGLSLIVGALKTNTALESLRISLGAPEHGRLPVALAEALTVNRTLGALHVFLGLITNEAARGLVAAVARNTALRTFKCRLGAYGHTEENAAAVKQIRDKVRANASIEDAGNALADLSQRPEWTVPIPPEVGQSIAALVAQVGADRRRQQMMLAIVEAGTLG
jgi:hypothetical protein